MCAGALLKEDLVLPFPGEKERERDRNLKRGKQLKCYSFPPTSRGASCEYGPKWHRKGWHEDCPGRCSGGRCNLQLLAHFVLTYMYPHGKPSCLLQCWKFRFWLNPLSWDVSFNGGGFPSPLCRCWPTILTCCPEGSWPTLLQLVVCSKVKFLSSPTTLSSNSSLISSRASRTLQGDALPGKRTKMNIHFSRASIPLEYFLGVGTTDFGKWCM